MKKIKIKVVAILFKWFKKQCDECKQDLLVSEAKNILNLPLSRADVILNKFSKKMLEVDEIVSEDVKNFINKR